ncbi:hypothetical protein Back11_46010 [Paenibacillus baekrokdamisoli]|uniref:Uncharacterized protein n=1 Tax=Paenibacillus baekrokdamisoli TaxID=1712516 RepID=A0A3G9IXL3_9BACL|nr:hypothetical protein [Paenibacillus baekrokdamisoli]MBB3072386.1 hypothetical protein [Paenibacillus baekrokdamisoli]BBH23256.1 hypothetical protein Back11_46010 [Paenibacillus baekrokdamisoli]
MSIERQLVKEFEQDSQNRKCPPDLDTRITAEYRQQVMQQRGKPFMPRKWKMPKVVLIAIIVMIVCGFAYTGSKLLFTDKNGNATVNVHSNQQLKLEKDALERVRLTLKEVKSQLGPGETAVVYVSDFDFYGSWLGAFNPVTLSEIEQWKTKLKEHEVEEKLPDSLLGSFDFVEGMEGDPFFPALGTDAISVWEGMKAESKKTGSKTLWRKTIGSSIKPTSPYTSVFRNSNQDSIYLTWDIVNGPTVKFEMMTPPNTSYEELDINGLKAHYTKDEQSLYGDSNINQDVMWIKESGGKTIVYHVRSDSLDMTKEQLVEAAKSLL